MPIEDELAIREVLTRYCRGVDRCDEELLRSVYHPDATDDHGTFKGNGYEFAAWVTKILREHMEATTHHVTQALIAIDGDRATSESYVLAFHRRREGDQLVLDTVSGRYLDVLDKRAGEWKLSDRRVVIDWGKTEPLEREFPADAFLQGARQPDDPSY